VRLDEYAMRDLDNAEIVGDQRLVAEAESVLFTRLAILGFKMASFGYFGAGFVSDEGSAIIEDRLSVNAGAGLRFNNPRLVIPTIELRAGVLSTAAGAEPVFTVRFGRESPLRRGIPSAKPETIPYR
jgi:hypothetical protein